VLEAMQSGAAVITSDRSSLPEVGGDGARYVDPTSETSIRTGLAELLTNDEDRAGLGERARRRAREFSWDRTAAEVLTQLTALAPSTRS
jgi:glycosyltransferase involved in cell wall biosynthesis